jgi:starch synthase
MKILFASSEAHPLIKTGGLADVSGSLPTALKQLGEDCRLILPGYPAAIENSGPLEAVAELEFAGYNGPIRILEGVLPDSEVPLYLVDAPMYFNRAGDPYRAPNGHDWQDNHQRFSLLSLATAALAMDDAGLDWKPDILHCNDWQTGLAPALIHDRHDRPATIFTVHNLAYQGLFPLHAFHELSLPQHLWAPHYMEFHGHFSFIKGGLVFADRITTVSKTYAREIRSQEYGYGLEGLLEFRKSVLCGILNGIDTTVWDPSIDKCLAATYNLEDLSGKKENKRAVQQELGLDENPNIPLISHIGRMVEQKGIDLILHAMREILETTDVQLVILGNGERHFEQQTLQLQSDFPGRVGVHIGYNEILAHQIEGGADLFLMPSRFEPCGLNQMYSLRYGTIPVVRHTGGLADTIIDTTPETLENNTANGFSFTTPDIDGLIACTERALDCLNDDHCRNMVVRNGMSRDSSWENSASEYMNLYREVL